MRTKQVLSDVKHVRWDLLECEAASRGRLSLNRKVERRAMKEEDVHPTEGVLSSPDIEEMNGLPGIRFQLFSFR